MSTPTLINLPPPPSNPETPSDLGPGTPGSTTTSLSALSTTAIKDGHQGHASHGASHGHQHSTSSSSSTNTLDAERADRISRLAGLERVATVRGHAGSSQLAPGAGLGPLPPPGYFDGGAAAVKERSTVGSASATGSVGGRTTWASGSDANDVDKMSEDPDDGVSSVGGFSDEGNASLVGFGEGATSTADGPISSLGRPVAGPGRPGGMASPTVGRAGNQPWSQNTTAAGASPAEARMIDGMTYDANVVDTANRPAPAIGRHEHSSAVETAEDIMRQRSRPGPGHASSLDQADDHRGRMETEEQ